MKKYWVITFYTFFYSGFGFSEDLLHDFYKEYLNEKNTNNIDEKYFYDKSVIEIKNQIKNRNRSSRTQINSSVLTMGRNIVYKNKNFNIEDRIKKIKKEIGKNKKKGNSLPHEQFTITKIDNYKQFLSLFFDIVEYVEKDIKCNNEILHNFIESILNNYIVIFREEENIRMIKTFLDLCLEEYFSIECCEMSLKEYLKKTKNSENNFLQAIKKRINLSFKTIPLLDMLKLVFLIPENEIINNHEWCYCLGKIKNQLGAFMKKSIQICKEAYYYSP